MSEQDKFEAWWKTLNVYDPTLKALAGSAWMEATRTEESQVQKEITVSDQEGEIKLFEIWWKKHAGVMAGPPEFRRFGKRKARNAWLARASYDAHDFSDKAWELCADKASTADLSILGGPHDVCVMPSSEQPEAMALLKKPEPQPQKTRVRLWVSGGELNIRDSGGYVIAVDSEVKHDSDGFYVENQQ